MPSPSSALTTLRPDLADAFEEYPLLASREGYVGLDLFPELSVDTQSGQYGIIPVEQVKRLAVDSDLKRAVTGGYSRIDWQFETASYATEEYGMEVPVDHREQAMYTNYFDSEMVSADIARKVVLDAFEKKAIDAAIAADGSATSISTAWTTAATAVPITDIGNGIKAVWDATGVRPNTICMAWKDFWNLKLTAQWQDYVKHTQFSGPDVLGTSLLAQAVGVEKVLVAGAIRNTAAQDETASLAQIWPVGKIWIGVTASANANFRTFCVGRTHHWASDASRIDGMVEQYEEPQTRRTIIRVRHDIQVKTLYASACKVLTGASS